MFKRIGKALAFFAIHLGFIILLFSILRFLFYVFNLSYFTDAEFRSFLGGIRFDWMTATLLYLPFLLVFPFLFHRRSKVLKVLFLVSSGIAIAFNAIDFEYYKFTLKRTTADLFTTAGMAADVKNLFFTFLIDYWYVVLLAVLLFWLTAKGYGFIQRYETIKLSVLEKIVLFLILMAIYVPGTRGGLQYRPLNMIHASAYASSKNMALVLNTPFTVIKSAFKTDLERKAYFTDTELEEIYSPIHEFKGEGKDLNVVIIIAESFSKEYIGALNDYDGYTPFLDSLIGQGRVYPNAFANGKKSIEGLPAILSGIPTLMNKSFITSRFAANRMESLPLALRSRGYETAFYHGGENGTMGFDAFSHLAGIERYVGKNEYPYPGGYDGNWGIFDEPFLQFCAEDIDRMKQPFFAGIFTLSSHHPYTVPTPYDTLFEGGPLPILKSVQYADYSLKRFFETIRTKPWFENTVFVITADHTSQSFNGIYSTPIGVYRIPIVFYSPNFIAPEIDEKIIQQTDIYPEIIGLLEMESTVLAFGNDVTAGHTNRFAISYLNEIYQIIQGDYCMHHDGEKIIAIYNWKLDSFLKNNLILSDNNFTDTNIIEKKLKAVIQQYNNRLIENNLLP